jgi:hypothetical protein
VSSKKSISDKVFEEISVPFMVAKSRDVRMVWKNDTGMAELDLDLQEVERVGSYLIQGCEFFSADEFCSQDILTFYADCYGGPGTAGNGGGARCGNFKDIQVKGIGPNCLVGSNPLNGYSSGVLHLEDALIETVYSELFKKIMPVGVAPVLAVLVTGKGKAERHYDADRECPNWGSLLVRPKKLRVGHFLRADFFTPKPEHRHKTKKDTARVRDACRALVQSFSSTNELVKFLGMFLLSSAKQLSFARVNRIMHGAMSPSNICFDGSWLDLGTSTFIASGRNVMARVGPTPSFLEEAESIDSMVSEVIHNIWKYTGVALKADLLRNYYFEMLESGFYLYTAELFGTDLSDKESYEDVPGLVNISGIVNTIVRGDGRVAVDTPTWFEDNDPLLILVESLFISLFNPKNALIHVKRSRDPLSFDVECVFNNFSSFMRYSYNVGSNGESYDAFVRARMIFCLRRTLFSSFFYRERVKRQIIEVIKSVDEVGGLAVSTYLGEVSDFSAWVFSGPEECQYLVETNSKSLVYDPRVDGFRVSDYKDDRLSCLLSFNELKAYLSGTDELGVIHGFELDYFMNRLCSTIEETYR